MSDPPDFDDNFDDSESPRDYLATPAASPSPPPSEGPGTTALDDLSVLLELDPGAERVTLRGKQLSDVTHELEFLSAHFPQLRHLDLSENSLAELPADVGLMLPRLVALDLSCNTIDFDNPEALAKSLGSCSRLKSLSVPLAGGQEDEQRLLELLPGLRILNGTPLYNPGTFGAGDVDVDVGQSNSTPSSPQAKRDLRLRFHTIKQSQRAAESAAAVSKASNPKRAIYRTTPATNGNNNSVRPRELPASISDDRTDWRKLLKSKNSNHSVQTNGQRSGSSLMNSSATKSPLHRPDRSKMQRQRAEQHLLSTEAFLEELKDVVRGFHDCESGRGNKLQSSETLAILEQLDKHVERLAKQLGDQEKACDRAGSPGSQLEARVSVLRSRWSLLELCGAFGAEKAAAVDGNLGSALSRLLQLQKEVLTALQEVKRQALINPSATSKTTNKIGSTKLSTGTSQQQPRQQEQQQNLQQQQQQLKVLLEVAETLESDLEGLQLQFQQEKARRELLEQENTALKRQLQTSKEAVPAVNSSTAPVGSSIPESKTTSVQPKNTARNSSTARLRKRGSPCKAPKSISNDQIREVEPTSKDLDPGDGGSGQQVAMTSQTTVTSMSTGPVRNLTLKQILDIIRGILQSKSRGNDGRPRETLEQHMYTYLNTRFGLPKLIVDYASAIWKASNRFAARDNEVAVFLALLKNQLDEGFLTIKRKLQRALADLLRAYLQAKHPLKAEAAVTALVKSRLTGIIFEDEWTELLTYLYELHDVSSHFCFLT